MAEPKGYTQFQDWRVVKGTNTNQPKKKGSTTGERAMAQAMLKGQEVESVRKNVGVNHTKMTGQTIAKIINNEEEFKHETVTHDFKLSLQKARSAAGLKQEELAKRINEKASVIQEYESGRAIPNSQIISKLEKALGCKLPRQKPEVKAPKASAPKKK